MKQDITKADNMKKLLFILLVSFSALNAQTTFSDADIDAAAGNRYETLLTNVDIVDSDGANPEPSLSVVPVEKKEKTVKEYIKINDLTDFEKKVIINNLQSQLQNNWLRFSSQSVKEANFTIKVSQTKGDTNAYYQTEGTLPGLQSFLNKLSAGIHSHDNELQDTLQVSIHNGQVSITYQ